MTTDPWFPVPIALFDAAVSLEPTARLAYIYLLRWGADRGQAFPGYPRMAAETGLSRSTAIRAIRALVAAGLVIKEARPGRSNVYRVVAPCPPDVVADTPADSAGSSVSVELPGDNSPAAVDNPVDTAGGSGQGDPGGVSRRPGRGVTLTPDLDLIDLDQLTHRDPARACDPLQPAGVSAERFWHRWPRRLSTVIAPRDCPAPPSRFRPPDGGRHGGTDDGFRGRPPWTAGRCPVCRWDAVFPGTDPPTCAYCGARLEVVACLTP